MPQLQVRLLVSTAVFLLVTASGFNAAGLPSADSNVFDSSTLAAQEWPDYVDPVGGGESFRRGPGFYLSWWKMLLCVPIFLFWVKAADWVNVDLHRTKDQTKLDMDTWNNALSLTFLGGFIVLLCIPLFWIGYPLYLVAGILPYSLYLFQRNPKVASNERTWFPINRSRVVDNTPIVLKQDEGVPIEFTAGGDSPQRQQANLIAARQNPYFLQIKEFVQDFMIKRADRVLLEFSQQACAVQYDVDGVWLPMPPRDRQTADAILYGLKQLGSLNPMDRQTDRMVLLWLNSARRVSRSNCRAPAFQPASE